MKSIKFCLPERPDSDSSLALFSETVSDRYPPRNAKKPLIGLTWKFLATVSVWEETLAYHRKRLWTSLELFDSFFSRRESRSGKENQKYF